MKPLRIGTVMGAVAGLAMASHGVTLQYSMTTEFSGGQAPAGPTPWVRLTLTDVGQPVGSVSLTIDNLGLTGGENMESLFFNYDDLEDLGALTFSFGSTTGDFEFPEITVDENGLKADGDGYFDIRLSFATGSVDDSVFGADETLELLISGGVTPLDFSFLSEPAGGHGPFAAAAHIQNTTGAGTGGSGWIAGTVGGPFGPPPPPPPPPTGVPDSAHTLGLLGVGLMGVALVGRRMRR